MSLNRQIQDLIKDRPQYNIQPGYAENQKLAGQSLALSKNQAFGRDRSIMGQEKNLDQNIANTMYDAQNASGSTSSLLNALTQLNSSKNTALRGLGSDEAAIQNQKMSQVYNQAMGLQGANTAMSEEQDKAWNYNVNDPYQNKMNMLVQKQKFRRGLLMKGLDVIGSVGSSLLGGKGGMPSNVNVNTGGGNSGGWGGDVG